MDACSSRVLVSLEPFPEESLRARPKEPAVKVGVVAVAGHTSRRQARPVGPRGVYRVVSNRYVSRQQAVCTVTVRRRGRTPPGSTRSGKHYLGARSRLEAASWERAAFPAGATA